jgi:hypothetical protein
MDKFRYIRFPVNWKSEDSPGNPGLFQKLLGKIIPEANPDFDRYIQMVETWLLEIDCRTRYPSREIGLDKNGKTIVILPFGGNYGYWTDNDLYLEDFKSAFKVTDITNGQFEKAWVAFSNVTR